MELKNQRCVGVREDVKKYAAQPQSREEKSLLSTTREVAPDAMIIAELGGAVTITPLKNRRELCGSPRKEINMTSYSSCLVLLMLVSNSYTRSLNPNDVSLSPKKPSRMQPPANAAAYDIFTLANDNENAIEENAQQESKQTPVSSAIDSPMPILSKQSENPQPLPVIKLNSFMKASQGGERQGKHVITPDLVKVKTVRPGEDASTGGSTIISTKAPVVTTTTEDPWDAFCSEACQEGLAGPECDCAEHPIGRRHAPSPSLFYDMGQRP